MFEELLTAYHKRQAESMVRFMNCRDPYRFAYLLRCESATMETFLKRAEEMVKELEELGE